MSSRFYLARPGASSATPAPRLPSGPGRPLPADTRAALEPRFRHDFSRVRVHSDGESSGAPAHTVGRDIVLGRGMGAPDSASSRRLIAHELAHVVQGERGGAAAGVAEAEDEARQAGEAAAAGRDAPVARAAPAGHALCAPPDLAPRPMAPEVGWKAPGLTQKWYALEGFDTKEAVLKSDHLATIDEVVKDLAREPLMGGFITVIGHADAIGTNPDNKALGQQRADAVRSALVDGGVAPEDVRAGSVGEEVLAVDTKKAEAKNRRVQIVVWRRRMDFGLPPRTPAPRVGPVKQGAPEKRRPESVVPEEKSEEQQAADRRAEFERKVRQLAIDKGAPQETLFDEAVKYLARNAGPDLANEIADLASGMGINRKWVKERVEKGIEKGIEAGLKEALKAILVAVAGTPSTRPSSDTGPATVDPPKVTGFNVPVPFPGDQPKAANTSNATVQVTDRLSASMTKTVYRSGDFISFRFTTPESFGQAHAVVDIVPAAGGTAVQSKTINGRRSGSESLAVPESAGRYVLQVRLAGEEAHPRATFHFSVE